MNKPPRWHKDAPAPKRPDRPMWATAAAPAKPKPKHKRRAAYREAPDAGLRRILGVE